MPVLSTRGARIDYSKAGAGPAILLIQGAGVVGEGWRPQIDRLRCQYTVYAFTNRGMSGSPMEDGSSLTIDDMADDALAIMNAEGVHHFHVVGHSMGGLIAQALTLTTRDRIKSLALLCTFARGAEGARVSPATIMTGLRVRIGTKRMRRNAFLELIMAQRISSERRSTTTRARDGAIVWLRSRKLTVLRHASAAGDDPL